VQAALIFPNLTGRGTPARAGRGREGVGGGWKFYRDLLAARNRPAAREGEGGEEEARNDRGITNGARRKKGAKKGGTACQRNNAADAKANKMPSGVAPINHCVRMYHLPFGPRRGAPRRCIR
jgi:hypothetical protein